MPLSGLPRTNVSSALHVKVVDGIPSDCCGGKGRVRRRPTETTVLTSACSHSTDSNGGRCDLQVLDMSFDHDTRLTSPPHSVDSDTNGETDEVSTGSGYHLSMDPTSVHQELMMSPELLKENGKHISRLLRKNQRALASLIQAPPSPLPPLLLPVSPASSTASFATAEEEINVVRSKVVDPQQSTKTKTKRASSWKQAIQFEYQQSIPGVVSLVIYCIAHASSYELISNTVYEGLEAANTMTTSKPGTYHNDAYLYALVLVLGCLLARFLGLAWDFIGPLSYERVKFVYHNRLRMGAKDAVYLHWLQETFSESAIGCLHIVSYYCVYIGVVFYVNQLAFLCDFQRKDILSKMPSALYLQELRTKMMTMEPPAFVCPAHDYSPQAIFGDGSGVGSNHDNATDYYYNSNIDTYQWDPLGCSQDDTMEIFGTEDDAYLYRRLSKNSYDHFLGQEYETPLFDNTRQILFYAGLACVAICTLKGGFGFSFWSGW